MIRAAIGVEHQDGYLQEPEEALQAVRDVVHAALACGIYVIIDFHSHKAHELQEQAIHFFETVATQYGAYPHVIFEIWNEPQHGVGWEAVKSYSRGVLPRIREASTNLVLLPTTSWASGEPTEDIGEVVKDGNVAFSMHAYMNSREHAHEMQARVHHAVSKGAVFVTEWGTSPWHGKGDIAESDSRDWLETLRYHSVGYAMWHISDKQQESFSALRADRPCGEWSFDDLTKNGRFMRQLLHESKPVASFRLDVSGQNQVKLHTVRPGCGGAFGSLAIDESRNEVFCDSGGADWTLEADSRGVKIKHVSGRYLALHDERNRNPYSRWLQLSDKGTRWKAAVRPCGDLWLEVLDEVPEQGWVLSLHRSDTLDKRDESSTFACVHSPPLPRFMMDWRPEPSLSLIPSFRGPFRMQATQNEALGQYVAIGRGRNEKSRYASLEPLGAVWTAERLDPSSLIRISELHGRVLCFHGGLQEDVLDEDSGEVYLHEATEHWDTLWRLEPGSRAGWVALRLAKDHGSEAIGWYLSLDTEATRLVVHRSSRAEFILEDPLD